MSHSSAYDPNFEWDRIRPLQVVNEVTPTDYKLPKPAESVRFVCISDTHTRTKGLETRIPDGDVLLHAGDFTKVGEAPGVQEFSNFLGGLPHPFKIVIAGNHDLSFEAKTFDQTFPRLAKGNPDDHRHAKSLLRNCIYLEDSGVEVLGVKIWGSPWTPWFFDWAFNAERGRECAEKWAQIPDATQILITHGPPLGHGDLCSNGQRAGCLDLLRTIQERVKPAYHVFGHIHEGYGVTTDGTTTFVNPSICDLRYRPLQNPIVFDLVPSPTEPSPLFPIVAATDSAASAGSSQHPGVAGV
eukprot:CAMPEP_0113690986 /NCGR_PEP_ID=MMETSP0038_2-20120614/18144_1 /TAXON_ID=2898 /ORGANISM="Cryptomonas paramecium" /LENGTH=297 /DNA_ID=CAMNT_0000612469 /DNA_START=64 /DNA_END=957 /DNA_ORIENTATION=+ /assembly_acc=CAM_ASM_000170